MKLLYLVLYVAIIYTMLSPPANAQNCGPRKRRDWNSMSALEKEVYREAIKAAMKSGAYNKFIELHTEMQSEMEAHGQCMFIFWHRVMLIAFENMLRGQGTRYACVTIPTWDWMSDQARMASGECTCLANCSPILNELGSTSLSLGDRLIHINGVNTTGSCMYGSPLNSFCESSTANTCAGCVPRGNLDSSKFPGATSYASVMNQVFSARNYADFVYKIQFGAHNSLHSVLDGAMATFAAPADPIFYPLHATVDLLHVVFQKCRVGTNHLTFEQKANHPVAWSSCLRRDGYPFKPTDSITMRTGALGRNPINAREDPIIGRYFNDIPNQYAALMDPRDLGVNSYVYELSPMTGAMYNDCGNGDVPGSKRDLRSESQEDMPESERSPSLTPVQASIPAPGLDSGVVINSSVQKMMSWYKMMLTFFGGSNQEAMDKVEKMRCLFQDRCLGGVQDYTPEFKQVFGPAQPRCKVIVDKFYAENNMFMELFKKILNVMIDYFGCPSKAMETPATVAPPL